MKTQWTMMPKIIESCTEINSKSMQNSRQRRRCFLEASGVNFCRKKVLGGRGFEWLWRPYSATNRKKGHPIDAKIVKNQECVADAVLKRFWRVPGLSPESFFDPLWRPFSVKNQKTASEKVSKNWSWKGAENRCQKGAKMKPKWVPNVWFLCDCNKMLII